MTELTILLSTDPEANRFRFFVIELHRREDGSATLHKRWGRIGTEGQHAIEEFSTAALAEGARAALIDRRVRRGYVRVRRRRANDATLEPLVTWEAQLACALEQMRRELTSRREALRPATEHDPAQLVLPL